MIDEKEMKNQQQHKENPNAVLPSIPIGMLEGDDEVIAGVSGGADSVCLFLLLCELQKKIGFSFHVVHVEHGIRGAESKADAAFVESLCAKKKVNCARYDVDVPAYAIEQGIGIEEAARQLRYQCLEQEANRYGKSGKKVKIALAHHADDNAETILFQMVRGSGIDGLCGMKPVRKIKDNVFLIRPLLGLRRSEIEDYLKQEQQEYCTDATNEDTDYSRNKIRHQVLPLLQEINMQAVAHINQSAQLLRDMADYMSQKVAQASADCCEPKESGVLVLQKLWQEYPAILQKETLHHILEQVAGSSKDITAVHVQKLLELEGRQVGKSVSLPYQLTAIRQYEGIWIGTVSRQNEELNEEVFSITKEMLKKAAPKEGLTVQAGSGKWNFRVVTYQGNIEEIGQKAYTEWLDYDKISDRLQIRKRRQGDYLTVDMQGHTKKLKQYFVNEKIPQEKRNAIWLLTEGAHVIWILGGRISAYYKVSKDTKRVLEVRFVEE